MKTSMREKGYCNTSSFLMIRSTCILTSGFLRHVEFTQVEYIAVLTHSLILFWKDQTYFCTNIYIYKTLFVPLTVIDWNINKTKQPFADNSHLPLTFMSMKSSQHSVSKSAPVVIEIRWNTCLRWRRNCMQGIER